jgi:bifunctional non-homologous end joining protein LigD
VPAPDIAPMLADRGIPRSLAGWVFEPKFDGWRVRVLVDAPGVRVLTRGGMDITDRVPELKPLRIRPIPMVLDGELVAEAGRAQDFYAITPPLRKRRDAASPGLTFVAFDLLWLNGRSLVDWSCEARRALLEEVELPAGAIVTSRWPGSEAARLIEACGDLGVEGIVMKRLGSPYRPGERSSDWCKLKVGGWAEEHLPRRSSDERWRHSARG